MELLLFGGTSEGRNLAQWLSGRGWRVTVCVATEYGAELIEPGEGIAPAVGRLDRAGMEAQMRSRPYACVVDATHPYAVEVTEHISAAAQAAGLPQYRLVRDGDVQGSWNEVADMAGAAQMVRALPGPALLTTGSKELDAFAAPELRVRCYPRVLPSVDSLSRCLSLGFPPGNILCMQGPFSQGLNTAMIRQYGIRTLVTKASGAAGGFWEKEAAARETGCALVVVRRPVRETGLTLQALFAQLEALKKGDGA